MCASGHLCLASQGLQRSHHTPSSTHHQPVLTSKSQESSGHRASYCASSASGRSRQGLELSLFKSVSKSSSYKTKDGAQSRHPPCKMSRHDTCLFLYQGRPWALYLQIRTLAQPGKNLIYQVIFVNLKEWGRKPFHTRHVSIYQPSPEINNKVRYKKLLVLFINNSISVITLFHLATLAVWVFHLHKHLMISLYEQLPS